MDGADLYGDVHVYSNQYGTCGKSHIASQKATTAQAMHKNDMLVESNQSDQHDPPLALNHQEPF